SVVGRPPGTARRPDPSPPMLPLGDGEHSGPGPGPSARFAGAAARALTPQAVLAARRAPAQTREDHPRAAATDGGDARSSVGYRPIPLDTRAHWRSRSPTVGGGPGPYGRLSLPRHTSLDRGARVPGCGKSGPGTADTGVRRGIRPLVFPAGS